MFGQLRADILPMDRESLDLPKDREGPSHAFYVYRGFDLTIQKGLATPFRMDKSGPMWVHTHWSSTDIDSHACVMVTSTRTQAHSNKDNSRKSFLQTMTEFQEDKLGH